jgi:hypothetical protein
VHKHAVIGLEDEVGIGTADIDAYTRHDRLKLSPAWKDCQHCRGHATPTAADRARGAIAGSNRYEGKG